VKGFPNGLSDVPRWGDKAVEKVTAAASKAIPGLLDDGPEPAGPRLAETPEDDEPEANAPEDQEPVAATFTDGSFDDSPETMEGDGDWEDVPDDDETGVAETEATDQNDGESDADPQESEASDPEAEDDEEKVSIRLTKTIERIGLKEGQVMQATPFGTGVVVQIEGGKNQTLTNNEYELADESVSA
jgi:hypothetical protein